MEIGDIVNGIVLQRGSSSHQLSLGDAHAEDLPRALQMRDPTPPFTQPPKLPLKKTRDIFHPRYFFFFFFWLLPNISKPKHKSTRQPTLFIHVPVVLSVGPIGCWNIRRVGTCSLVK